jgi:basic amino acid/polyamine antiporter, APA family
MKPVPELRRTLGLPLLVLYGLGVTIGAGIFALIGEIAGLAGDHAPLAFLIAGLVAAATGYSYAVLAAAFPRAGGEAVFVNMGLGANWARLVGLGVLLTAIISSATITLAFAGYVSAVVALPRWAIIITIVSLLAGLAAWGIRESVWFAAMVTILEVGTLLVVIATSAAHIDSADVARIFSLPADINAAQGIIAASFLAFFAFIGFEDIENMAEETVNPQRVLPRAIFLTLILTVLIYAAIATVAASVPGREILPGNPAPLAALFHLATGQSGTAIAAMAAIAIINGILVQIMMGSRLIYGMAREGLVPAAIGAVNPARQTPVRAICVLAGLIMLLALTFPLSLLAETTSGIILAVFTMVNLSLWRIGRRPDAPPKLRRVCGWGILAAILSAALLIFDLVSDQLKN